MQYSILRSPQHRSISFSDHFSKQVCIVDKTQKVSKKQISTKTSSPSFYWRFLVLLMLQNALGMTAVVYNKNFRLLFSF